ncbi:MAG: hypothetical protein V4465_01440 [Patescibacteria group bacterium]
MWGLLTFGFVSAGLGLVHSLWFVDRPEYSYEQRLTYVRGFRWVPLLCLMLMIASKLVSLPFLTNVTWTGVVLGIVECAVAWAAVDYTRMHGNPTVKRISF